MDTTKLTREEALRRWNASKENKRKMVGNHLLLHIAR